MCYKKKLVKKRSREPRCNVIQQFKSMAQFKIPNMHHDSELGNQSTENKVTKDLEHMKKLLTVPLHEHCSSSSLRFRCSCFVPLKCAETVPLVKDIDRFIILGYYL